MYKHEDVTFQKLKWRSLLGTESSSSNDVSKRDKLNQKIKRWLCIFSPM